MALLPSGYEISYRGMKSYNGVAVLTRTKPELVRAGLDDGAEPDEPRLLHVVVNGITVINTYIPQGFEIDSHPNMPTSLSGSAAARTSRNIFHRRCPPSGAAT